MMERDEQQLDRLFAAYRDACPAPEVSADFMPELWRQIDARRGFQLALRRWTRGVVAAATAVCLAMVLYMAAPWDSDRTVYSTTYLDTLEQPEEFETLAYTEMVDVEFIEASGAQ
jgi:hypothetical protein